MALDFKPAKCPSCGGDLQLPENTERLICMYCGGAVLVRDAIHAAALATLANLIKLARTALKSRNYREAYDYFTRILESDSDNWEAWAGKAEASGLMSGPQELRLQEIVTCFGNALQFVPDEERKKTEDKVESFVDMIAGRYYTHVRAALSPGFAEEYYWQTYLSEVRNIIVALEDTYKLLPNSSVLVKAIVHVCRDNYDRVSFINRFGGVPSLRTIPPDMRAFVEKRLTGHSTKLEAAHANIERPVSLDHAASDMESAASRTRTKQHVLIAIAGVLVLIAIIVLGVSTSTSVNYSSANASRKFPGTSDEKAYLEATLRYLTVSYDQCKSAATTMASADGGNVTLDEIRTALNSSQRAIDRSWNNDFLPVANKSVPTRFADIDKKIRDVHTSQQAAFQELLSYWDDRNTTHITNGSEMFKRSLLACDSTIKDLNKILDRL